MTLQLVLTASLEKIKRRLHVVDVLAVHGKFLFLEWLHNPISVLRYESPSSMIIVLLGSHIWEAVPVYYMYGPYLSRGFVTFFPGSRTGLLPQNFYAFDTKPIEMSFLHLTKQNITLEPLL